MNKYWITRLGDQLEIRNLAPNVLGVLYRSDVVDLFFWPALGLPHEPKDTDVWEVEWVESIAYRAEDVRAIVIVGRGWAGMSPRARNVTEELKETGHA